MVAIGELAFKATFNATQLTRGLMSTRQQMTAAKKLAEDTRTPLDRYRQGLDNLAQMSKKYSVFAEKQVELSKQLERSYLQEESAVRKLTKAEKSRLELLQLSDKIKERAAAAPGQTRAARDASNRQAGLARQSFLQGIDNQQTSGRAALAARLAAFKKDKAARAASYDANSDPMFAAMHFGRTASTFRSMPKQSMRQTPVMPAGQNQGESGFSPMLGFTKRALAVTAVAATLKSSIGKFAEVEKAAASFDVLTGSMQQSKRLMEELRSLSSTSPISFDAAAQSAKTMLSFGVATEQIMPTLIALGNIAGGDSEKLKSLALAFGQTTAAGRLMGQEVLQMINAGFNPLAEISRTTGKSMAQLKKEMEEGGISSSMVANSLVTATSAGGRFNGMLAKIEDTTAGSLAKAASQLEMMGITLGEKLAPAVVQLTQGFMDMQPALEPVFWLIQKMGEGLGFLAAAMGDIANNDSSFAKSTAFLDKLEKRQRGGTGGELANKPDSSAAEAAKLQAEQQATATKQSNLASLQGSQLEAKTKPEDYEKYTRALSLMTDAQKEYATREFTEYGDVKAVYSILDESVRLELEKLDALERQNKLRSEEESLLAKQKQDGKAMAERNMTAAEKYKQQLDEIAKLQSVGAIDRRTGLRERMAIQSQLQQEMGKGVPQELMAGSSRFAPTMTMGSAEFIKYLQDYEQLSTSSDPQVAELEKIAKQNEQAITEAKRQTKLLEKVVETAPRKIRG